jgi:hypothetical protein
MPCTDAAPVRYATCIAELHVKCVGLATLQFPISERKVKNVDMCCESDMTTLMCAFHTTPGRGAERQAQGQEALW